MAFTSPYAFSTITDPCCQSGWITQQQALSFSSHARMFISFDFPTITKAVGILFSHSSNTLSTYKGYYS